jgi:predicted PurR-regulated permease PerM
LVGVGFAIFGVPQPIFWGTVAAVMAMVPSVGTALVTIPAILYLAIVGQFLPAIGLLAWSLILVHSIDNFLGPILISRKATIHPFLIFLSVIGGLGFFGPIGFLLGPIVLSISLALLDIYSIPEKN